jgi:hypothetical protein
MEREVWVETKLGGHWELVASESVWLILIGSLAFIINMGTAFVKVCEEKRKEAIKEFYGESCGGRKRGKRAEGSCGEGVDDS